MSLSFMKYVFCLSGLSAFAITPLAVLSLGAMIPDILEKVLEVSSRLMEYKMAYHFYMDLLFQYKIGTTTTTELDLKQKEFLTQLHYLPREKYLKRMHLNGYP